MKSSTHTVGVEVGIEVVSVGEAVTVRVAVGGTVLVGEKVDVGL